MMENDDVDDNEEDEERITMMQSITVAGDRKAHTLRSMREISKSSRRLWRPQPAPT